MLLSQHLSYQNFKRDKGESETGKLKDLVNMLAHYYSLA